MRILFMGTPDFAAASLEKLLENGFDVCGVFTQPDKPKSRGMKIEPTPVKQIALKYDVPVYQPEKIKDGTAAALVKEINPDVIVVVAYGKILPKEILDAPRFGCINIHGSLLPKYRGSAPIQWAVLNGDKVTGVTSMYVTEKMDSGDIIDTAETEIGEYETSGELFDRLKYLGADLLCKTLVSIENGTVKSRKQNEDEATYVTMLSKEDSPIDWTKSENEIISKICGLNPWPVATARFGETTFKIFKALKTGEGAKGTPGEVISCDKNGLKVACGDGAVLITVLQAPGGKKMSAADYFRGHPLC